MPPVACVLWAGGDRPPHCWQNITTLSVAPTLKVVFQNIKDSGWAVLVRCSCRSWGAQWQTGRVEEKPGVASHGDGRYFSLTVNICCECFAWNAWMAVCKFCVLCGSDHKQIIKSCFQVVNSWRPNSHCPLQPAESPKNRRFVRYLCSLPQFALQCYQEPRRTLALLFAEAPMHFHYSFFQSAAKCELASSVQPNVFLLFANNYRSLTPMLKVFWDLCRQGMYLSVIVGLIQKAS